jgi:hypothetical protein
VTAPRSVQRTILSALIDAAYKAPQTVPIAGGVDRGRVRWRTASSAQIPLPASPPEAAIGDAGLEAGIVGTLHEQLRPPAATGTSDIADLVAALHDLLTGRAARHRPPAVLYRSAADTRTGAWLLRTSSDDSMTRSWI